MRGFIAFEIDEKGMEHISSIYENVRYNGVTWIKKEHLHITIAFFEDVGEDKVDILKDIVVKNNIESHIPYPINKMSAFPSESYPRVVWVGSDIVSDAVKSVYEDITPYLDSAGIEYSKNENFKPHVTIGRIKRKVDFQSLKKELGKNFKPFTVNIVTVSLFESILEKSGAIYRKIV